VTVSLRPTAHIVTYGCQMNENDSEVMLAYLEEMGYEWCPVAEDADLVMVNSCCVRKSAEDRALGRVGELKRVKDQRPSMFIGLTGCMPQQPGRAEEIARRAPHLNLVMGTHNLARFPELALKAANSAATVVEIAPEPDQLPAFPRGQVPGARVSAWVTILRGCDKRCTYCIVPYVRGREMSRPLDEIVSEVQTLVGQGVREVSLLGQNVNAYGKDRPQDGVTFGGLLRRLEEVDGLWRIRYTTSHPRDFTQDMIDTIAASKKVSDHFHLPAQSGANAMLKRMARGYLIDRYLDLIHRVRAAIPEATLTTDLIVGFPGESEADFEQTLQLVEEVRFDRSYMFMYSPRRGTPAADFPDQVPLAVKQQRLARLMEVQDRISLEKNQRLVGRTVQVLVEGPSPKRPEVLTGRAFDNRTVLFPGDVALTGTLVPVRLLTAHTWTMLGEQAS
jgi:tRNA-2-methylthio-N6-dimethylallyladenosine synthase